MKKISFISILSLSALGVFAQSSQMCLVQVTSNSAGNKCYGDCNGTANSFPTGTGSYVFSWSNGATTQNVVGLCAGTYTITVKDLGDGTKCMNTVTITEPAKLNAGLNGIPSVSCAGFCNAVATIAAGGGTAPYTYSWIPGGETTPSVSGLCAVPYQCNVTDANGCKTSVSVIPNSPSPLTVAPSTAGNTATANTSGGTPPYTYSWNPTGQTGQTATGLTSGTYTVTVTDKNGCVKVATVTVTTTGINNNSSMEGFVHVFPNPASDFITIETATNLVSVKVTMANVLGEIVLTEFLASGKSTKKIIDISHLEKGVYFITVNSSNGSTTRKIIKE